MNKFYSAAYSDAGTVKTVNQDSLSVKIAEAGGRETAFAVICDGMGGLEQGELASATVVRAFEKWHSEELSGLLTQHASEQELAKALKKSWEALAFACNDRIRKYGQTHATQLGTTLTALLLAGGYFYILHIGDCRVYEFTKAHTAVLTKDQTYVAREVALGHMTPEQARHDSRRSVLLQCIGVNETKTLQPDFISGTLPERAAYLLCTDGFWHEPPREVLSRTCWSDMQMLDWSEENRRENAQSMQEILAGLAVRSKQRGERDNLSAILIQVQ